MSLFVSLLLYKLNEPVNIAIKYRPRYSEKQLAMTQKGSISLLVMKFMVFLVVNVRKSVSSLSFFVAYLPSLVCTDGIESIKTRITKSSTKIAAIFPVIFNTLLIRLIINLMLTKLLYLPLIIRK